MGSHKAPLELGRPVMRQWSGSGRFQVVQPSAVSCQEGRSGGSFWLRAVPREDFAESWGVGGGVRGA